MSRDDLFSSFKNDGLSAAAAAEKRHAMFEEQCVLRLLRTGEITINKNAVREAIYATYSQRHLSFMWFANEFSTFPVRLHAAKLRNTSGEHVGWTEFFGPSFMSLPWMEEYRRAVNAADINLETEAFALIFNAPHAKGAATMAIHNFVSPIRLPVDNSTRIVREYKKPKVRYTIEPFGSFAETACALWKSLQ